MIEQDEKTLPINGNVTAPVAAPSRRFQAKRRAAPAIVPTSVRDLAYVVFRWKWDISLIVFLALLGSASYLWLVRGVLYETSAKLLVKLGQEQAPPTTMLGDRTLLISQRPQDVNSEIDILKSTDLLERVVTKLGLDQPSQPDPMPDAWLPRMGYEIRKYKTLVKANYKELLIQAGLKKRMTPHEEAIFVLQHALTVEAYPESNVFIATLRTPQPKGAGAILNGVVEEYIEFRRTMFTDDQSVDYFKGQVEASQEAVRAVESDIAEFQTQNDFQNVKQQEELLLTTREESRRRMKEAEVSHELALMKKGRFDAISKDSSSDFSSVGEFEENSYPASLMLELVQLAKEHEDVREGTGAPAQKLSKVQRKRAAVLSMLDKYLSALEAERRQEYESIKAQFDETNAKLEQIRAAQTSESEYQRALKVAQDNYYFYRQRLEESEAVSNMQQKRIGNVSVIQHAIDPSEPAGVGRFKLFIFGIAFSIFAALSWAAVREFFNHTINTSEQLRRRVSAPVLATIPTMAHRREA